MGIDVPSSSSHASNVSGNFSTFQTTTPAVTTWEDSPSYKEFFVGSYNFIVVNFVRTTNGNYSFTHDLPADFAKCIRNLSLCDLYILIALSVVWTWLRDAMSKHIFRPTSDMFHLDKDGKEKLPESMWKAFFYGLSWSFTAYVLIVQENGRYFQRPTTVWTDYAIDAKVSTTVYIVYLAQASFYIHSLYATIFQDSWRKDSVVLLVHHVVATILLTVSWSARYHFFGLTCIFLHDCCDVLLEVTKSFNYLKNQQKGVVKSFEVVADIGFLCFTATWFVMRLYLFPLRVLYYSSVYVEQEGIYTPFGFFLNMLMYLLLAMNVYWFTLILHVLYKVVIGQTLEDVRDFKEDEEEAEVLQVLKPSDVGDDKRKKINDKN